MGWCDLCGTCLAWVTSGFVCYKCPGHVIHVSDSTEYGPETKEPQ